MTVMANVWSDAASGPDLHVRYDFGSPERVNVKWAVLVDIDEVLAAKTHLDRVTPAMVRVMTPLSSLVLVDEDYEVVLED